VGGGGVRGLGRGSVNVLLFFSFLLSFFLKKSLFPPHASHEPLDSHHYCRLCSLPPTISLSLSLSLSLPLSLYLYLTIYLSIYLPLSLSPPSNAPTVRC
jgi:hypothetical protein